MADPFENNPGARPMPHPGTIDVVVGGRNAAEFAARLKATATSFGIPLEVKTLDVINDGGGHTPMTQAEADTAKLAAEGANTAATLRTENARLQAQLLACREKRDNLAAQVRDLSCEATTLACKLDEEKAMHKATQKHLLGQKIEAIAAGWIPPDEAAALKEACAIFEKNSADAVAVDDRRRKAEDENVKLRLQLFTITSALESVPGLQHIAREAGREQTKKIHGSIDRLLDLIRLHVDAYCGLVHAEVETLCGLLGKTFAPPKKAQALVVDPILDDAALIEMRRKHKHGRIYVNRWTTGERTIQAAVDVVERMGADPRLTRAVIKLGEARAAVADFVEGVEPPEPACSFGCDSHDVKNGHRETCPLAVPRI